jgi:hypothetical protein
MHAQIADMSRARADGAGCGHCGWFALFIMHDDVRKYTVNSFFDNISLRRKRSCGLGANSLSRPLQRRGPGAPAAPGQIFHPCELMESESMVAVNNCWILITPEPAFKTPHTGSAALHARQESPFGAVQSLPRPSAFMSAKQMQIYAHP